MKGIPKPDVKKKSDPGALCEAERGCDGTAPQSCGPRWPCVRLTFLSTCHMLAILHTGSLSAFMPAFRRLGDLHFPEEKWGHCDSCLDTCDSPQMAARGLHWDGPYAHRDGAQDILVKFNRPAQRKQLLKCRCNLLRSCPLCFFLYHQLAWKIWWGFSRALRLTLFDLPVASIILC